MHYYKTKSEFVFNYLKEQIIHGKIPQGENINISELSKELNMSAIPIREALQKLSSFGLVIYEPHKGVTVSSFTREKIVEVLSIRALLEGYSCTTAVPYINDEILEKLTEMHKQMKKLQKIMDTENYAIIDKEFHRLIYKSCPFPMLYDMIFNLWDGYIWTKSIFSFFPEKMLISIKEHQEIINAIKNNDSDRAEMLVRKQHLSEIKYYNILLNNKDSNLSPNLSQTE